MKVDSFGKGEAGDQQDADERHPPYQLAVYRWLI